MSTEDLEKYETEMELQLYREYRDIVRQFTYVVETERRFYLANAVDLQVHGVGQVEAPFGLHHVRELPDDVPILAIELQLHLGLVLLQVLGAHRGSPDTGRMAPSSTMPAAPVSWSTRSACASR